MGSSLVNVRVAGGTLWIGNAAYVLKNITSIEPVQFHGSERPQPRQLNWIGILLIVCGAVCLALVAGPGLLGLSWPVILIILVAGTGVYVYKKHWLGTLAVCEAVYVTLVAGSWLLGLPWPVAIILILVAGTGVYAYKKRGKLPLPRAYLSRLSRARVWVRRHMPSIWTNPPAPRSWNYYEIRISTAGRERRALTVGNWATARDLTTRIADAIANPNSPDTVFSMQVENLNVDTYHVGDNNTTYGPNSPIGGWHD